MRRSVKHIGYVGAVAGLLLVGCGGEAESLAPAAESAASEDAAAPAADSSAVGGTEELALAADGTPLTMNAGLQVMHNMVRECMTDRGWTYVADLQSPDDIAESDRDAYVRAWGYGIASDVPEEAVPKPPNPNADYVSGRGDEDRKAYFADLFGGSDIEERSQGGFGIESCAGAADAATFGETGRAELEAKLDEAKATVAENTEMIQTGRAWVECMEGRGHQYGSLAAPREDIYGRAYALREQGFELDSSEVAALRELELRIAQDDWDCFKEADIKTVRDRLLREAQSEIG